MSVPPAAAPAWSRHICREEWIWCMWMRSSPAAMNAVMANEEEAVMPFSLQSVANDHISDNHNPGLGTRSRAYTLQPPK